MATSGSGSKLLKEVEITEERSGYSSPSRHQAEKNRHRAGRKLKEKEHLTVFCKKKKYNNKLLPQLFSAGAEVVGGSSGLTAGPGGHLVNFNHHPDPH